ncbi:MAG: preprotein translocase subunit SecY [Eubacterium sp.]|nr:preprotein translocase subunit SecY [Eubacterium sp.]
MTKKGNLVVGKILFTIMILLIYIVGRSIPLYGINAEVYPFLGYNNNILMQSIGGDALRTSLFALGISPYMLSTIFVQIVMAFRSSDLRSRTSPKKVNRISLTVTLFLAAVMAITHLDELKFYDTGYMLFLVKIAVCAQMITGAMIIIFLCTRNKKYGIGGQSAIILVNITDGLVNTLLSSNYKDLEIPVALSVIAFFVVIFMESKEYRVPLMRVSIHNIHADKNYLAIKYNPIGVMPVMFSSAAFMVPKLIATVLVALFPRSDEFKAFNNILELNNPYGIAVYLLLLLLLTVVFSFVFIGPKDIAEQFQKSGDCIPGVQAGWDTRWFIRRRVFLLSIFSAVLMGACIGIPMYLNYFGYIHSDLEMLPSSVMMFTGILCSIIQEVIAVHHLDAYESFL